MTVIVLTACPTGLRGHLTRWLLEISAGVFVGSVNARVRDLLWDRVVELSSGGRALMVFSVDGEQHLSFKVHDHQWEPADYDGVTLIRRPADGAPAASPTAGWSRAGRMRRFARRTRDGGGTADHPEPN
ncbi:MAG: type I-E CRISPR-associated endoribonuclease Cas2 [Coriobacteriia bacterium]|nr:type I-E CRISPR-associated endoribonuclease Cas2 [Coriobacteriia bacterium]